MTPSILSLTLQLVFWFCLTIVAIGLTHSLFKSRPYVVDLLLDRFSNLSLVQRLFMTHDSVCEKKVCFFWQYLSVFPCNEGHVYFAHSLFRIEDTGWKMQAFPLIFSIEHVKHVNSRAPLRRLKWVFASPTLCLLSVLFELIKETNCFKLIVPSVQHSVYWFILSLYLFS